MMQRKPKKLLVLGGMVLLWTAVASAEPPVAKSSRRAVSIGIPWDGKLQQGEVLPRKGAGYQLIEISRQRRARFGVPELIAMIKEVAFRLERRQPGGVLGVADLSKRIGGPIEHHGSHQSGRDVDLLFYLLDMKGNPVVNTRFVPVDKNGFSTEPPMVYRFDTVRNWELIVALIHSRRAKVQWIFVSKAIKSLLLSHAEQQGASPSVIRKAEQMLRQPGEKTHADHFHVRIYCPRGDRPACRDVGRRWAWAR